VVVEELRAVVAVQAPHHAIGHSLTRPCSASCTTAWLLPSTARRRLQPLTTSTTESVAAKCPLLLPPLCSTRSISSAPGAPRPRRSARSAPPPSRAAAGAAPPARGAASGAATRDAARHRGAADAPQLLEHLGSLASSSPQRTRSRAMRSRLRLQALGAAVIQRLPDAFDRHHASQVLPRPATPLPRRLARRSRHGAHRVLAVPAQHPLHLIEQRAASRRDPQRARTARASPARTHVQQPQSQAPLSRCHRRPPVTSSFE
jgi:hypothetical protein